MRTLNLKSGYPTVDAARRRLLAEIEAAREAGVKLLKVIHGWGSSGAGGRLGPAIRRSLRLEDSAALRTVGAASGSPR